ncbi:MAG: fibronectin type III domain-containing protein, partial [Desulfobacteraceae bacterium]|nr:fibronectin type III domain-containing protein [Desulfobacteraceae bacterium]
DLVVQSGDNELDLSWQPPHELVDGTPLEGGPLRYQVERSQNNEAFAPLGSPVDEPRYVDHKVRNGVTYRYRVRALRPVEETYLGGLPSEPVTATPRDLTPPAPPRELIALKTPEGVRLVWAAGAEPDLAGYRIYRRIGSETAVRIGEVSVPNTSFIDREPPTRGRVFYTVTAIDTAQPPNESPPSLEAEVIF